MVAFNRTTPLEWRALLGELRIGRPSATGSPTPALHVCRRRVCAAGGGAFFSTTTGGGGGAACGTDPMMPPITPARPRRRGRRRARRRPTTPCTPVEGGSSSSLMMATSLGIALGCISFPASKLPGNHFHDFNWGCCRRWRRGRRRRRREARPGSWSTASSATDR